MCKLSFLCVHFLNAQLVSNDNLISWSFTIYDHLLSDSVHNVKNVKALWEWLKYRLFVLDKFGFEKSHGNRNFGFDLWVQFGFLKNKTEPKFGFCTSLEHSPMRSYDPQSEKKKIIIKLEIGKYEYNTPIVLT